MKNLSTAIRLREAGDFEEARTLLLKLVEQDALNPSVWYQTAWIHDVMELEKEAIPYYVRSLELGLECQEREGALLGLGSTYRTLGRYEDAKSILEAAIEEFPERREFRVFYAMVLYNLKEHAQAMEEMMKQLAETSSDEGIRDYKKAILFYSDKLERIWE